MKYNSLFMLIDAEYHEEIRKFLRDDEGLVPAKPGRETGFSDGEGIDFSEDEKLIWEDENGIGYWRVDFMPDQENYGDLILFRYWAHAAESEEIQERDPMLEVMKKVYGLGKTKECVVTASKKYRNGTRFRKMP